MKLRAMRNITWLIMAQYYSQPGDRPFEGEYPRVMGFYEAETPEKAFDLFLEEFATNLSRAQIFYDEVTVIPCQSSQGYQFSMKAQFGELARFPNPAVIKDRK